MKIRYRVFVMVGDRDLSKYTDSPRQAELILQNMKDAAATLGLLDIFRGEIHEVNR